MASRDFPMRRSTLIALALVTQPIWAPEANASEHSGVATLTSEYIYRGLARSNGNPAAQLGWDFEHDSGLFAGAWASTIDLSSASGQRDLELDLYIGYHRELSADIAATVTLLRYTYPDHDSTHSYDYNEMLVRLTWLQHYSVEVAYTNDLNGFGRTGRHWEFQAEWPIANAWLISAALGSNDLSDAGVSRYLHWDVGASARFNRLTFDLRWFDNQTPGGFAARSSAGSQVVLSVSAGF